jgi:hypothetical protein
MLRYFPRLRVVLIRAYSKMEFYRRGLQSGAAEFAVVEVFSCQHLKR